MTRYDPFAYGQVRLGDQEKAAADDPDDILFAGGDQPMAPQGADSSWGLMDEDMSSLLPGAASSAPMPVDFGSDILGEGAFDDVPAPAAKPAALRPRAAESPRAPEPASSSQPTAAPRREVGSNLAPIAATAPVAAAASGTRAGHRRRQPSKAWQYVVPLGVLAAGGVTAAWLQFAHDNVVISGFVGALTLVVAAFSLVFLRR